MSERQSLEWKTKRPGVVERQSVHPLGFQRYERINTAANVRIVSDSYPNSFRTIYNFDKPGDSMTASIAEAFKNIGFKGEKVAFADDKTRSVMLLKTSEDDAAILALLDRKDTKGKEATAIPFDQEKVVDDIALIAGHYNAGILESLVLQAEVITPDMAMSSILERPKSWKTSLPKLMEIVRYQQDSDPDNLELHKMVEEESYVETISEKLSSKEHHPLVAEIEQQVNGMMAVLIDATPGDDREEAIKIFDSIGLRATLAGSLLDYVLKVQIESVKDIKSFSVDDFLDLHLQTEVDSFNFESNFFITQRLLEVNKITSLGFNCKQLDLEYKQGVVYEKETVESGTATFGQEITVQENSFILEDDGNHMLVSCLQRGKLIWRSTLPKQLDFKSIRQAIINLDADFRQVKPFLTGASINIFK